MKIQPDNHSPGRWTAFRNWIINHDDSWLFLILYIGLAVTLSIWISLFWLVIVVAIHFGFEWVKQSVQGQGWARTLLEALWETKLDFALVLFALALSLYMEVLLGIVGLRSAAQVSNVARGGARLAAWENALRGFFLSVDDAAQVARAVAVGGNSEDANPDGSESDVQMLNQPSLWGSWSGSWGKGDWIAAGLMVICILLIIIAPMLTDHTYATALLTLAEELHPYPITE